MIFLCERIDYFNSNYKKNIETNFTKCRKSNLKLSLEISNNKILKRGTLLSNVLFFVKKKRGKLIISHRSTSDLCYVPVLEELEGAGRIRLTPATKVVSFLRRAIYLFDIL